MISRGRAIGAALVLCALSVCGLGAVSASAAPELTAVTCQEKGAGSAYNNSHCNTPKVPGNFETSVLPLNETTEVTGHSTEEEPALRATIGGAAITVKCSSDEAVEGFGGNTEPSPGKHVISGKGRVTFTGCHAVLKSNEARKCVVSGVTAPGGEGMISTVALVGASTGVGHQGKVEPAAGTTLTEFTIKKKGTNPATENECFFNNDLPVTVSGSIEGEANTTNHSHGTATEANNGTGLKIGGASAKLIGTAGGFMKGTENTVGAETFT